jgi:spore germination cell wall hydrolase CwlJ-like protein
LRLDIATAALIVIAAVLTIANIKRPAISRQEEPETSSYTQTETASAATVTAVEPEAVSRYAGVEISDEDKETLARLVYREARGEPFEGQVAVVEVVLNRCLSEYFPDTVSEVVYQKLGGVWQFSPAPYLSTAEPGETQYEAVETAISETEYILPEETVFFSTSPYNEAVAAKIGNHYFCNVN